jgi:hypothetical protein
MSALTRSAAGSNGSVGSPDAALNSSVMTVPLADVIDETAHAAALRC